MRSLERKLDLILYQIEHLAGAVAAIGAQLAAGSDQATIDKATSDLKVATAKLRASVAANQPK